MKRARLTHVDERGAARMVDVGAKEATRRRAVARGRVRFSAEAFRLLRGNALAKGDAVAVARVAGIQAGKRTAEWIPLCHVVPLDALEVAIALEARTRSAVITATAEARGPTGVEMEALVAVSAAALALYDMAKGVDRGIEIGGIVLIEKSGGRSGAWRRGARSST
jgi:cyclic pyranopterin phosphate synthase